MSHETPSKPPDSDDLNHDLDVLQDSSWALDRQPLEASKPPGVGEVLLSDNGEALLEGLLTNFFVVRRAEGGANRASLETHAETSPSKQHKLHERMKTPSGHKEGFEGTNDAEKVVCAATDGRGKEGKTFSANSRWQNLVVQTAALEEGVLPGVVRRAVLR